MAVVKIPPHYYVHIEDRNTCLTRLEIGPQNLTLRIQDSLVQEPTKMIIVPPGHYCHIRNPVLMEAGKPVLDQNGQPKIRFGEEEIRFNSEPFPLFPGEEVLLES